MTLHNLARVLPARNSLMPSFILSLWFPFSNHTCQGHSCRGTFAHVIISAHSALPPFSTAFRFSLHCHLLHEASPATPPYISNPSSTLTHLCSSFFALLIITYFHPTQLICLYLHFPIWLASTTKTRILVSYVLCFIPSTLSSAWHIRGAMLIYVERMNK